MAALNAAEGRWASERDAEAASARRLPAERMQTADVAFATHDFGDAEVEYASRWESRGTSDRLERAVHLAGRDGAPGARTWFTVEFDAEAPWVLSAGTTV